MNKKQKKVLIRIIAAVVLLIALAFVPSEGWLQFALYMIPYLVIGYDILKKAVKGILNRQVFDENFLMAVATIGAIALGDYKEGVAVMLFYQIGELFQSYAVGKSRRNISELMDIRPDYANVEQDGELVQVDPDEVEIGMVILVKPGEKIPIDGIVVEGASSLNTSALTGESLPREAKEGDEVISGCINMTGLLKIRTTKEFGESTVSKILELVENSSEKKAVSIALQNLARNSGAGGEFQFKKIQIRELYFQVRKNLYSGGLLRCSCPCINSPHCENGIYGTSGRLRYMDLQSIDIPCYQLSLCTGHQYSFKLLCRNRRCEQGRGSGQRLQLSGNSFQDQICCI